MISVKLRQKIATIIISTLCLILLPPLFVFTTASAFAAAGDLDLTFNPYGDIPGTVITPIGTSVPKFSFIQSITVDGTGKIVAGGYSNDSDGSSNFTLTQYLRNGSLDPDFGTDGIVITPNIGTSVPKFSYIQSITVDGTGKIVAGGYSKDSDGSFNFTLARYLSTGVLDSTFNAGGYIPGIVITRNIGTLFPKFSVITSIALDGNGEIVAGGYSQNSEMGTNFTLARYLSTGVLDSTFNAGGGIPGILVTPKIGAEVSPDNILNDIAIDSHGKIVAGGYSSDTDSGTNFTLARYLSTGVLDSTFNAGGGIPGILVIM